MPPRLARVETDALEIAYEESGDPAYAAIEEALAAQPVITVPAVVLHGACDAVDPPETSVDAARFFSGPYRREVVPVAGHFLPRESPESVVRAVRELAP
jgi:pimeloyl-ACP methyl ester carboxylesterase